MPLQKSLNNDRMKVNLLEKYELFSALAPHLLRLPNKAEIQRSVRCLRKYNLRVWVLFNSMFWYCLEINTLLQMQVHRLILVIYNSTLLSKLNYSTAKHSNPESLFSLAVTLICGEMAAHNTHNSPALRGKLSVPLVQMELASQGALRPAGKARACLDDWLNSGLIFCHSGPWAGCKDPRCNPQIRAPHGALQITPTAWLHVRLRASAARTLD